MCVHMIMVSVWNGSGGGIWCVCSGGVWCVVVAFGVSVCVVAFGVWWWRLVCGGGVWCVVAFGVWWWCLVCACVVASGCGVALQYTQHCLAYQPTYSTSIAIHVVLCSSLHLLPASLGLHREG